MISSRNRFEKFSRDKFQGFLERNTFQIFSPFISKQFWKKKKFNGLLGRNQFYEFLKNNMF